MVQFGSSIHGGLGIRAGMLDEDFAHQDIWLVLRLGVMVAGVAVVRLVEFFGLFGYVEGEWVVA